MHNGKLTVALVALLLSGCAGQDAPGPRATGSDALPGTPDALAPAAATLRFAIGDFAGNLTGTSEFSATAQALVGVDNGGTDIVDLTGIVPADAPVELGIQVHGANAYLELVDTYAIGLDENARGESDGTSTTFAPILVRAPTGKVLLHVYNPGPFGSFPPGTTATVAWEAASLVRAGVLASGVPAALPMAPGERLNLTAAGVEEAVLIAPDGTLTRDQEAPIELVANGTAGEYTLIMTGTEATPVLGPNVTMAAKRLVTVREEPHPLDGPTTWTYSPPGTPIQLGLVITGRYTIVPGFGNVPEPQSYSTGWTYKVTAATGVDVLTEDDSFCDPFCGGGYRSTSTTDLLDDRLRPGAYTVDLQFSGSSSEAYLFATVIQ